MRPGAHEPNRLPRTVWSIGLALACLAYAAVPGATASPAWNLLDSTTGSARAVFAILAVLSLSLPFVVRMGDPRPNLVLTMAACAGYVLLSLSVGRYALDNYRSTGEAVGVGGAVLWMKVGATHVALAIEAGRTAARLR